ncbi:MAG: methionyl-tRNA formyltransferase [Methylococcaceae bacterium]|uniref:methionyl-tRNA formyltransferase n=1 Tax=Methylicorpusculum sp. TaxID=2713644 RepID=UPI00271A1FC9|nr:methionyl-tRNA formyltransferase [Methylicorpusculum sp.]MDO9164214.1 methionyl-tRNA formyltransferase [Methylococcaceae bacterium]MDZ4156018.1 methionyl-tRNA formyltransferase [Methylococcales bacterium]MDP2395163.1 methionyl-tRNA formyltransferase [Methylococcaceae bacterium]MDP3018695.1 methionyl-tRNA formyltransferase [Methylococcaceae bacterium]MDP3388889.1 methionyl-tRNA formyltransferase [Methylococcaceae bacterium]
MKIIFAGTPEFAVPSLQLLLDSEHEVCGVYTQPDRPAGRGRKLQPGPVKSLALSADIPVLQPLTFKTEDELNQLLAFKADLMVVVAYGMILPQTVLDAFPLGCINVHGSLLPRWRGAAPIHRALMAGDDKTGVTIMQIVRKLDAGDMLHKEEYVIGSEDTASDLHDHLAHLGAIGLVKVLAQIKAGTLQAERQDESLVTYAEKLEKAEADIDWTQPARQLALKVRGLNAWPVAQTQYQNQVLRIWLAQAIDEESDLVPGTVKCTHKIIDVATGAGWLRLLEVQLPGGKRIPAQAFLAAHNMDGVILG